MMLYFNLFIFLILLSTVSSYKTSGKRIEGKLNVHLVPHTHDDVGWLKTVDQYYYGANNSIQNAGVQYILDTVVTNLVENPNRKFIYVEQAYFQRWWNEQNDEMQQTVKKLVANGQLEFINGGWCMHDEASTHYVAMIDQTTLGHRYLKRQFGAVPKIGWQIDPFGHSSTQAALLSARVGFKGLFFARIDYQDSEERNANKQYEMIWRPSPSLGLNGQIFTGAFERNFYGAPYTFDWDSASNDPPIQDDQNLEDYNVKDRVDTFVLEALDQFSANQGNDIMLTLGSDFEYSNAHTWYKNLDKLIHYVNLDGRLNIFYSTPSLYVEAKMASNITWTVKTDDFFPYADCPHCYWTGYFTSRPALKRYVRMNSAYLNMARQLEVLVGGDGSKTLPLEEAVGVAQHHDAVSGTSMQHVAYDYAKRISKGVDVAAGMVNDALSKIITMNVTTPLVQCNLLNETICDITTMSNSFTVVVYNPLARARTELVKIPVGTGTFTVYDETGTVIPSQTVASFVPFPKGGTPAPFVVYFLAKTNGLGFNTYFVQMSSQKKPKTPKMVNLNPSEPNVLIENSAVIVEFSSTTGRLSAITNKNTNITTKVDQNFLWYASASSTDPNFQNSGAYIFRPNSTMAYAACSGIPKLQMVTGSVVQEIRYIACDWLAQTVRLSGDNNYVEFEYQVSAIPIGDGVGKEVISRFSTDVVSASLYYTDSNGREFQTRRRNFRPTWPLEVNEPVSGNYYPVNTAAYIKDQSKQFSILNDRSQGGGSILDGQFELMVHRRLLWDDSRGVSEPLNETDGITPYPNPVRIGTGLHITGSHYVLLDTPGDAMRDLRNLQSRLFLPLTLTFAPLSGPDAIKNWISSHHGEGSAIKAQLPPNIDLITLQDTGNGEYLIRLAHQFAVGEDPKLSQPVTIDLSTIFTGLKLTNLKEVSLTANQDVMDLEPTVWNVGGDNANMNVETYPILPLKDNVVTINPMDIRTFIFS